MKMLFPFLLLILLISRNMATFKVPICTGFHYQGSTSVASKEIFSYSFDIAISQSDDEFSPNKLAITNVKIVNLDPKEYNQTSEIYVYYDCQNQNGLQCLGSSSDGNYIIVPDGVVIPVFDIHSIHSGDMTIGNTKLFLIDFQVFDGIDGHFMDPQSGIHSDPALCKLVDSGNLK